MLITIQSGDEVFVVVMMDGIQMDVIRKRKKKYEDEEKEEKHEDENVGEEGRVGGEKKVRKSERSLE